MTTSLMVVILWMILMLAVGIYAGVKHPVRNFDDWATGGRSLGYVVNYFTAHATQLSALTYMGFVALLYLTGPVAYFSHYIAYMLTTCAFLVLFSPRIWRLGKKFGHVTPTDLLAQYYGGGKWFRYIIGGSILLALIPYVQLQVTAAGYLFQLATNGAVPVLAGATVLYVVVAIYTWTGGFRAVAWTDVLQGIVLIGGLWIGALLITQNLGGGIGNVIQSALAKNPQTMAITGLNGWNYTYFLTWGIVLGFGFAFHAHMWIRNYSPKSEWDARTWPSIMLTMNVLNGIVLLLAGMALAVAMPGLTEGVDKLFLKTIGEQFHPVIYGLILSGALGAMLSSVDSQVHAMGVVITRDFVNASGKTLSDQQSVSLNRWVVVVAMGIGLFLAWLNQPLLAVIGSYAASLGLLLAPAVLAALTGQRWATRSGVMAGILLGLAIMVLFSGTLPGLAGLKDYGRIYFGFWGLIANVVGFVGVSLLTKSEAPSQEMVDTITNPAA